MVAIDAGATRAIQGLAADRRDVQASMFVDHEKIGRDIWGLVGKQQLGAYDAVSTCEEYSGSVAVTLNPWTARDHTPKTRHD